MLREGEEETRQSCESLRLSFIDPNALIMAAFRDPLYLNKPQTVKILSRPCHGHPKGAVPWDQQRMGSHQLSRSLLRLSGRADEAFWKRHKRVEEQHLWDRQVLSQTSDNYPV